FLDNVRQRNDALGAAKLIHHDSEPLGMGEKELEQIKRAHRFRYIGWGKQHLGVMVRWIEQKRFHIDNAENLVRCFRVDWHSAMPLLLQLRDRLVIRQVIG